MIPKNPAPDLIRGLAPDLIRGLAPDLIRGGYRFSEKHAFGLDPGDHAPTIG